METIYIGSSPYEEDCAQTTNPNYHRIAMLELKLYKRLLEALYPPPEGAFFKIVWQNHDFGTYGEVVAKFDEDNQAHADWAYLAEDGCATWDEPSKQELQALNTQLQGSNHKLPLNS